MRFRSLLAPIVLGLLFSLLSLNLWYGYFAGFILPEMYRPLHHWMYGVTLLAFGAWKSRRSYGKFLLVVGVVLLLDDLHDLLQIFNLSLSF